MNLTRALDVALPEIPARIIADRPPRLHPDIVFKEGIEDGEPIVRALVPEADCIFNLTPENWKVVRLFDGNRSYEEVARLYSAESGVEISADDARSIADGLAELDFWYKTPQERNILLLLKSAEERRSALKRKSKWADLGFVKFPAFDPDNFLIWLDARIGFVFTSWFQSVSLAAFAFMIGIYASHWEQFLHDTVEFYNFADKSGWDLALFWILTFILSAFHETAHGVACRHYGGRVSSMGFALVYLSPAFYTDTTSGVVLGNTFQRIMITVAGVWIEMWICALAAPIWWATPPATAVHELAYIVILITGVGVILINWNPLIKLDGYYILCDLFNILDLKENSTAYVSAWVKKHIWRLPVEVPFVPKRRRFWFAFYALLSGLYSYTVLYVIARFVGNVFRSFSPEWSFVPELATAGLIFRSRIRTLVNFMKFVYLDKKDRIRAWFTPRRSWTLSAAALVLLVLPIWHESIEGRFVLEPQNRAVLRAMVPGAVDAVFVREGQKVDAGAPVARLRNFTLQSRLGQLQSDYSVAQSRSNTALVQLASLGGITKDRDRLAQQTQAMQREVSSMELKSPISGVVVTARPEDRVSSYVKEGTELAEIADFSVLRARIYVSEYDMHRYREHSSSRISVDGMFEKRNAKIALVAPAASEIEPGLMDTNKYKGLAPPKFYVIDLLVDNADGGLKPGMVGTGRIYRGYRSLAGVGLQVAGEFFGRKLW